MAKRSVYDVKPDGDGGWDVKKRGNERASGNFGDKADAIGRAKELAKNAPLGQVVIRKLDNTIQTEHTYGQDPRSRKG